MSSPLFEPLALREGVTARSRVWLAPLTNRQSHPDGSLSREEVGFLGLRADGGFGLVESAGAFVAQDGKTWMGQLGVHDDAMLPGLTRLANRIHEGGALACVQLFHGGLRASSAVSGLPTWSASDPAEGDPAAHRAGTEEQIRGAIGAFAAAAARSARAGFDAVEVHGAHGYLPGQLLSRVDNRRTDGWGGPLEGRARFLREVVRAVRAAAPALAVLVRLSPEDFGQARGLDLDESLEVARWLVEDGMDVLHLSLWRSALPTQKRPDAHATRLFREAVGARPIVVAGAIWTREEAEAQLTLGADAIALGRAAIANHDWPRRVSAGQPVQRPPLPVATLRAEGVSPIFVSYLRAWKDFVAPPDPPALARIEKGEGEAVVLLHSGGSSSRQWRRLLEALGKTHHVVAPDLLGSGDNPPWAHDEPFDVSQDVEAVVRVVREAGAPAHLVGHSYGGFLALTIARLHPDLVRSVAVYDPVAFGVLFDGRDEEGIADLSRAREVPIFADEERGGSEAWMEVFVDYWMGVGAFRALPGPTREQFVRVGRKVFREVTSLLADRTTRAQWAQVKARTLLLGGGQSPPAARRVIARLAEAIPGARVALFPDAGHMGPITHAQRVNEEIVAHVREPGGTARSGP